MCAVRSTFDTQTHERERESIAVQPAKGSGAAGNGFHRLEAAKSQYQSHFNHSITCDLFPHIPHISLINQSLKGHVIEFQKIDLLLIV